MTYTQKKRSRSRRRAQPHASALGAILTTALATPALAQDAGSAITFDGGMDAAVMSTYFADDTDLSFPTPACGDPKDPDTEGCYTNFLVISDLEGDGDLDIVFANGGGYYQVGNAEPSSVYLNDGKGSFRDATESTFEGAASRLRQVAIGDIDGDGDRDIYQPGGYGLDLDKLWVQTSPGVFEDRAATSLPSQMLLLDGGVGTSMLPEDGGAMTVGLRSKAASAHFGDLDGDGDLDLAVGDWGDNRGSPKTETTVRLYENDGKGVFTALPLSLTPPPLPGPKPAALPADAGTLPDGGPLLPYLYSAGPLDLDMHDIDGDFDLDLLVIGRNGQSRIFFNDGGFVFSDGTAGYPPKNGPYQYNQELCDVDADGDLDLLVDNSGGIVKRGQYVTQVNLNDGKGFFTDYTAQLVSGEPGGDDNAVKCADVNGDGHFDLVTASLTHAGEKLLLNSGTGTFTFVPNAFPAIEDPSLGIDAADLDGDGFLDFVTGQGEGEPRIDRLYLGYGMSGQDKTAPKFRAVEHPMVMADKPIAIRMAVSDAVTSETGEHVSEVLVEYEIDGVKETLPAYFIGGDLFRVDLPAQPNGTVVKVSPSAIDRAGLIGTAASFEIVVGMIVPPVVDSGTPSSMDAGVPPVSSPDAGLPSDPGMEGEVDESPADDGCSVAPTGTRRGSGVLFVLGLLFLAGRRTRTFRSLRELLVATLLMVLGCGDDAGDEPTSEPSGDAEVAMDGSASADGASSDAGSQDAAVDASSSVDGAPGDASSGGDAGPSAAYLRGEALSKANACTSCHQANYAGAGFYPNITPHKVTGIGDWTVDEIKAAIVDGEGPDGELCALMTRYEFSPSELDDLVAFLRGLPAVNKSIGSTCPSR